METQNEQKQACENISKIFNPSGTPEAKRKAQQDEILRSVFGE